MITELEGCKITKNTIKNIVWEGPQFGYHSVALLNRELCLRLIDAGYDLSIIASGRPSFVPETNDRFHELSDRFNKKLKRPLNIHVRHQSQPNFTPPEVGHWVIMQHWEFGCLPKAWVEPMRQVVDEIWVPSSFIRECFIQSSVPDEKVFVIPTGVDTLKFQPGLNPFSLKTKKRFKFLSIGTTLYRKAIEAYCATFTSADDVCLVIKDMGGQSLHKGQTARKLISDIWEKDDAPEIEYVDQVMDESDLAGLYNACDCLFHPYGGEGFGQPIAEVMACGLPVIITGHGSALDFCSEDNAYLIPLRLLTFPEKRIGDKETVDFPWLAEPDFEALKGMLKHVIDHPEEALGKGKAGRLKIEKNFTWENTAHQVMRRLDSLRGKPILRFERQRHSKEGPIGGMISIILPVDKDTTYLKACVESIRRHTSVPYEMILVVNVSAEEKVREHLNQGPDRKADYQIIPCIENKGFAERYNDGVKESRGEYSLLLSTSAIATKNWLSGMLECFKSIPETGIVGPLSNLEKGPQQAVGSRFIFGKKVDHLAEKLRSKNRHRRIPCHTISGFCMLFSRKLFQIIGGFDEEFGSEGGVHSDFCLRAAMEGKTSLIAGDVYVHQQRTDPLLQSRRYFKRKWGNPDPQAPAGTKLLTLRAIQKGFEAYQRDNLDDAIKLLMEGIQHSPDNPLPYFELAEIMLQSHNFKAAMDIMKKLPKGADDLRRNEILGYGFLGLDLDQDAIQYARPAVSMNQKFAPSLNFLGLLALKLGKIESAEDFFKQAIGADPGYGAPHTNLGKLFQNDNPEKALDCFERGFILSPQIPDILSCYHSAITEAEQYKRAEPVFETSVSAYPLNKILKYRFIDVLIRQGKNEEAMDQIEEAIVLFGMDDGILTAALQIRGRLGPKKIQKNAKQKDKTVSLCMILKNEQERLAKCLKSIEPVVDEMVVVDIGSEDNTKDIARIFGAQVYDFERSKDFFAARNFSLSKASGDWLFVLDADEAISKLDHGAFRELLEKSFASPVAYSFETRNYTMLANTVGWRANDGTYEDEEAGVGWTPNVKVRLFPNRLGVHFRSPLHELVDPLLPECGISKQESGMPIHHYGKQDKIALGRELCVVNQ